MILLEVEPGLWVHASIDLPYTTRLSSTAEPRSTGSKEFHDALLPDAWLEELDRLLTRSPAYFVHRPVVVDVAALPQTRPALMGIVNELQARKIRVMALEGTETATLGADARGLPP